MTQRRLRPLRVDRGVLAVVGAGLLLRLVIAALHPPGFDLRNVLLAAEALRESGLSFYAALPEADPVPTYPYLPTFLPWVNLVDGVLGTDGRIALLLVRLPQILADAALALVVAAALPRGLARPAAAAAIVALHPVAIVTSGIEGQLDSIAFLPVLLAALVWARGGPRRALAAGLLISLGVLLKTPAVLGLVGLLPLARSRREAATLIAATAALPAAVLLPFALTEPAATLAVLDYRGLPGSGGLSMLAGSGPVIAVLPRAPELLDDVAPVLLIAGLAVVAAAVRRQRLDAVGSCAIVLLAVQIVGVNWFAQYALWPLGFAILAGAHRWMAASVVPASAFVLWYFDVPFTVSRRVELVGTVGFLLVCAVAIGVILSRASQPERPNRAPHGSGRPISLPRP